MQFLNIVYTETGFAGGLFLLLSPMYISEITEPSIRGALGSGVVFMMATGQAVVHALTIDKFLSWITISGISIAFPGKTHTHASYSGKSG